MKLLLITLTVLESLFSTLEQHTLVTDFSVTMGAQQAQPMTYNGSIRMQGECFAVNVLDVESAYDGKTLYVYQPDIDELSLSNPTDEELQQANPFLFAKAMRDACNITEREGKDGVTIITLTPKVKAEISRITLRVKTASQTAGKNLILPLSIEVREGTKTTTLKAKNPQWTTDKQVWTISKPGTYLNDLRL